MGGGHSKSGHTESHYMDYHPDMHDHSKIINYGDVGSHGGHSDQRNSATGAKVKAGLSVGGLGGGKGKKSSHHKNLLMNLEELDLTNL